MHLRVMKASYLKQINALDFIMNDNSFIISSTDLVESFACMELSDGNHKKIEDILMIYNRDNSILYPSSYYNKEHKQLKEKIRKKIENTPPYQNKIKNTKVAIIDIEDNNYKELLTYYKNNLRRTSDLFLVRNSLLHHYVDKLKKYDSISYINREDLQNTSKQILHTEKEETEKEETEKEETEKEETVDIVRQCIQKDITSNVVSKVSPIIIKVSKRRQKKQPIQTKELEATM
jgi:hypothetical protein